MGFDKNARTDRFQQVRMIFDIRPARTVYISKVSIEQAAGVIINDPTQNNALDLLTQ